MLIDIADVKMPENAGKIEAMLQEKEAHMQRIREILDQLEFERKWHIKMSALIDGDFAISMDHLEAADRIKMAIRIIEHATDDGHSPEDR